MPQSIAPATAPATVPARRLDLDWLRIGAFALLILYHIALFFGPWEWHLNSRHAAQWVGVLLIATNPWRLTLLYLISGVAVRYMAAKLPPGRLIVERSRRLLVPITFGALMLVPPQAYIQEVARNGLQQGYPAYWLSYWRNILWPAPGSCGGLDCIQVPLNHLWFIGYIWSYSLIAAALMWRPTLVERVATALGNLLGGARVLLFPILYLAVIRFALYPRFGITNHLLWDPYNHAISMAVFLLGFLLAFRESVWADLERMRWWSVLLAIPSGVWLAADAALPIPAQHPFALSTMGAFAINQWTMIAALLGFARRYLARGDGSARSGRVLAYLREGVFPFYLVHQTIIVIAAFWFERWSLAALPELLALLAVTSAGCIVAFEIARRIGWLRPLLGLRTSPPARRPQTYAKAGAARRSSSC